LLRRGKLGLNIVEEFIAGDQFSALGRLPSFLDLASDLLLSKRKDLVPLLKKLEGVSKHIIGGRIAP
jgi:hypothetical protein